MKADTQQAWLSFLTADVNRCHAIGLSRQIPNDITARVAASRRAGHLSIERMVSWVGDVKPRRALDLGCSTGMNALALAERWPDAEISGLEPEDEAVRVARAMTTELGVCNLSVSQGVGEALPFRDGTFDLITCITVIEHVRNVDATIREMARVLAPGGRLYLEAPNYVWPREPHLDIWTVPLFGKRFMRGCARLQGKGAQVGFLGHLQLVTPRRLERVFAESRLEWRNLVGEKARRAVNDSGQILAYPRIGRLLGALHRIGVMNVAVDVSEWIGLHPSVMYEVRKR